MARENRCKGRDCGELWVPVGTDGVSVCPRCGLVQSVSMAEDTKAICVAEDYFAKGGFDEALPRYEKLAMAGDAEAWWGMLLCRWGVEYVADADGRKLTVNRTSRDNIKETVEYRCAVAGATPEQRALYEADAEYIHSTVQEILSIAEREEPFDIFISFKDSRLDDASRKTDDWEAAGYIHQKLSAKGYRVFYSPITLKMEHAGQPYEPWIYAALHSAKVFLLVATDVAHILSPWVKNEWTRYLKIVKQEPDKRLIPMTTGVQRKDMPSELAERQGFALDQANTMLELLECIAPLFPEKASKPGSAPEDELSETAYREACELMKTKDYESATLLFDALEGYKDSEKRMRQCQALLRVKNKVATGSAGSTTSARDGTAETPGVVIDSTTGEMATPIRSAYVLTPETEGEHDILYMDAVQFVQNGGIISARSLQMKFGIELERAVALVRALSRNGVVATVSVPQSAEGLSPIGKVSASQTRPIEKEKASIDVTPATTGKATKDTTPATTEKTTINASPAEPQAVSDYESYQDYIDIRMTELTGKPVKREDKKKADIKPRATAKPKTTKPKADTKPKAADSKAEEMVSLAEDNPTSEKACDEMNDFWTTWNTEWEADKAKPKADKTEDDGPKDKTPKERIIDEWTQQTIDRAVASMVDKSGTRTGASKGTEADFCTSIADSCWFSYEYNRSYAGWVITGCLVRNKSNHSLMQIQIPSTHAGSPVVGIDNDAFLNRKEATSVILPNTIRFVGRYAFAGSGITEIVIPDSVLEIMPGAFAGCEQLSTVLLPAVRKVGARAFTKNLAGKMHVYAAPSKRPVSWHRDWANENVEVHWGETALPTSHLDADWGDFDI